jgi:hypothetical protein
MQLQNKMKSISGYIFKAILLLLTLAVMNQDLSGQDTLRTFGPRIGLDLAKFLYYFSDPAEYGAEISVDFEVYKNIYPVVELGYSNMSDSTDLFEYASSGSYGRFGLDYNVLSMKDRSIHHAFTVGARYGLSLFTQRAENMYIENGYWGDLLLDSYESSPRGHWIELVGGIKAEVLPNLFLGWLVRVKFLLNCDMDPNVTPALVPGYGNAAKSRGFGFSYSIYYKIPLVKN